MAQVAPALGAASSFAFFTAVGAFDNVGPSVIQGDIGTNAGAFSGFPPGVVNGTIHVADTRSTQAATDVQAAFGYMSTISCVVPLAVYGGPVSNPQVLTPNSYCVGAATTLAGSLILDGQGNPNAMFFLRVSGALTTGEGSTVSVINGASLNNVYWQITGRTDLGRNSVMRGTLLVDGAINLIEGASLLGRGLSRQGAITIDTGTGAVPVAIPTTTFWLGSRTTDWYTNSNWSAGVPTSLLDAVVPTGTSPYPLIDSGNAVAKSLTIGTSASLTQSGGALDVKGDVSNSGTISATAGNVSLSGTTAQAIGGTGSTQFWGLSLANSAGAAQSGAISIHGLLGLTNGNLTTNSRLLTLLSDATGTAMVVNTGGSVLGTATVQRYINPSLNNGLGYRHYSSPVQSTTVADLATSGFSPVVNPAYNTQGNTTVPFPTVYGFNEARIVGTSATTQDFDYGFFSPASLSAPLVRGFGYTVNINANEKIDLVGTLNTGNVPVGALTRGTEASSGWQLLGNPYAAPLDWKKARLNLPAGVVDAVYVYKSSSQYRGTYQFYQNGFGTLPNGLVSSMQGFFLRVSQPVASFNFVDAWRSDTYEDATFNRTTAETRPAVQLDLVSAQGTHEPAYVYFEAGATAGIDDHYDAEKLPNTTGLNLASVAAGTNLAVNGLPLLTAATIVPLSIGVPTTGTYLLQAASLLNLNTTDVYLHDALTGQQVNLQQQPSYSFLASNAALITGRFSLHFSPQRTLATKNSFTAASVSVYPNPTHNSFTLLVPAVSGATQATAVLYNVLGQPVREMTLALPAAGAKITLTVQGLALGVYTLRVKAGASTITKQVVVN
ncbi:ice-binding family protein [Hymenobacter sediminicola]|uniref:DUF3494 domain-containing protein n=1 Tax=Hymenobacter sediminicola TaxID=2761579 RepID=A0A7G7W2E7_9BACT|nr:ice-binding family protein [Hymenobacter sediminicola]QNH60540.1 DUF3494 domain-containing protein [Hymenobacter sediminicola]